MRNPWCRPRSSADAGKPLLQEGRAATGRQPTYRPPSHAHRASDPHFVRRRPTQHACSASSEVHNASSADCRRAGSSGGLVAPGAAGQAYHPATSRAPTRFVPKRPTFAKLFWHPSNRTPVQRVAPRQHSQTEGRVPENGPSEQPGRFSEPTKSLAARLLAQSKSRSGNTSASVLAARATVSREQKQNGPGSSVAGVLGGGAWLGVGCDGDLSMTSVGSPSMQERFSGVSGWRPPRLPYDG